VEAAFGRFQTTDRRMRLTDALRRFLAEAKRTGFVSAVLLDDSYVTAKDEPEDIDLIVVLPADWDQTRVLRPFEYNVVTRVGARRVGYAFDLYAYPDGSDGLRQMLDLFATVNPRKSAGLTSATRKGLLRVLP
jgi:hypothetical protein